MHNLIVLKTDLKFTSEQYNVQTRTRTHYYMQPHQHTLMYFNWLF